MPKTTLKRSLYIGLGGTGIRTILKTKKMFIDAYGEVPPMIQFLGIDTDLYVYERRERRGMYDDDNYLSRTESCPIDVPGGLADYYKINKESLSWIPLENIRIFLLSTSPSQVRTNGRLAFVYNFQRIKAAIEMAYARLSAVQSNDKFSIVDGRTEVSVVFSLAGGTGCGICIDVAYLVRKMFGPEVLLMGYAVLPMVFLDMVPVGPAMMRVLPNAYGVIQDLDYLMGLSRNDEPVKLNWISDAYTEEDFKCCPTPFDMVYAIDNTNNAGVKYDHIDQLTKVIALALFTASVESSVNRVYDAVAWCMVDGILDVNNKKAWVAGVGCSAIVFNGRKVAGIYADKVILRVLDRCLDSGKDGEMLAADWIDKNNIREGHGQDQVIDVLCSPKPKITLDISNPKDPKTEVYAYCGSVLSETRKSAEKAKDALIAEKTKSLRQAVSAYLKSGDYCVTTARDFLANVKTLINIFIGEKEEEKADFEAKTFILKQKMDIAVKSLKEEANKTILKRSKKRITEYTDDSINTSREYVITEIEIIRRLYAVQFFNAMLKTIEEQEQIVNLIAELMTGLKATVSASLNKITASGRAQTMEIDLAEDILRTLSVNDDTLVFNDFYTFVGEGGLESIKTTDELEKVLRAYAESLPEFGYWKEKTLADMIDSLSDEAFIEVCRRALQKAEPLLKIDSKEWTISNGIKLDQAIAHSIFIGVEDRENNRFKKSKDFREGVKEHIEFVSTGQKDRIIFFRQDFVVPAFAIQGVDDWKREYDVSRFFCHFDANIFNRMQSEGYNLFPSGQE